MLEVNLARRAPAIRRAPKPGPGPVSIELLPSEGRLSFRAKEKALGDRSAVASFPIDGRINSLKQNAGFAALRLGPDEWIFLCADDETDASIERATAAMNGAAHSLVDVSHRDVTFEVTGALADAVINAGCPLDLALRTFPVGSATRTLLGKCEIVLARVTETTWRVTCWRSFGPYVQGFLTDAAKDFAES